MAEELHLVLMALVDLEVGGDGVNATPGPANTGDANTGGGGGANGGSNGDSAAGSCGWGDRLAGFYTSGMFNLKTHYNKKREGEWS